jgi:hypothetical protein
LWYWANGSLSLCGLARLNRRDQRPRRLDEVFRARRAESGVSGMSIASWAMFGFAFIGQTFEERPKFLVDVPVVKRPVRGTGLFGP